MTTDRQPRALVVQRRKRSSLILRLDNFRESLIRFYDLESKGMHEADLLIITNTISDLYIKISELKQR